MLNAWRRWTFVAAACAAAAVLAGCAHPQLVKPGETESAVVEALGAPDAKVETKAGTRLVYSLQPMGRAVWWIWTDASGVVTKREEVLDRKHMALVKAGQSTVQDVQKLFGKCAQTYHFALKGEDARMYRFLDNGVIPMAFWVQYNPKTGVVTETAFTTDPWLDQDGNFPFG